MTTTLTPPAAPTAIRPFRVVIPDEALDGLRARLAQTRRPSQELVGDASQGVQLATVEQLVRYWRTEYDFGRLEARLNALPQFKTEIDGLDIHFIHVRSWHANAMPLLITHGWPGSVIEMLEVIGPLTDPTLHGGRAEDAFDVVLPSLPGYGFSDEPTTVGWSPGHVARAWAELMRRLGYTRYVAQGGDVGAAVTDAMAIQAPDGLVGIHLNFLRRPPVEIASALLGRAPVPDMTYEEGAAFEAFGRQARKGYIAEQGQSPQTIGYALSDSPAGLAAWILDHDADAYEKISRAFVDNSPAGGLTRDRILDNITLYWLTGSATSAARMYWEGARETAAAAATGHVPSVSLPVPSPCSRERSSGPRARGSSGSTPTSSRSPKPAWAGTSPPGRSHSCSPTKFARRSDRCADPTHKHPDRSHQ
jgi:pimeloyl-ACP methyl ester carboxylesterase